MKRMLLRLFLALTLSWQNLSAEESGRYQFELIVFSQGADAPTSSNPTKSQIQWPTVLTELSDSQKADINSLKDGVTKLLSKPSIQSIIHYAWQQSAGISNVILPMHIKSKDGRLDGFIQLRNTQPHDLIVDLEYKSMRLDTKGKSYLYHINEKRQIKLGEVHYFDHPTIGLLVQVNGI